MSKFDEFDLDIQSVGSNDQPEARTTGWGCELATAILCPSAVTNCDATACQGATNKGCTGNSISICHSYCGSACGY